MNNVIVCSSSITTDTGVILVPNREIKNLINTCNYRLIVACNINAPTSNLPIYIQTSLGNVPLLCRYGNTIYANMLNKRVNYCIGYGNENANYTIGQFTIQNTSCLNARSTIVESTTKLTSL